MYTLEQFKNLSINEGLNENEVNRKYFVYKSDHFYRNRSTSTSGSNANYVPPSEQYILPGYVDDGYVE